MNSHVRPPIGKVSAVQEEAAPVDTACEAQTLAFAKKRQFTMTARSIGFSPEEITELERLYKMSLGSS